MGLFFKSKTSSGRIPVSKIPKDWDAGFRDGSPLWQKGEEQRKAGHYEEAIALYDQARNRGYLAPALYKSYAMTYRKLKDRDAEIEILTEGITRMQAANGKIGNFETGIRDLTEQLKKAQQSK